MVARPDGLKTVTWTRGSSKTTAADYARVRGHMAIGAFLQGEVTSQTCPRARSSLVNSQVIVQKIVQMIVQMVV
jgi:hypothetical protein